MIGDLKKKQFLLCKKSFCGKILDRKIFEVFIEYNHTNETD